MNSTATSATRFPWYVGLIACFLISQGDPFKALQLGKMYFFLPQEPLVLVNTIAGIGLLLGSRASRYLAILVVLAQVGSVIATLIFWALQFVLPAVSFNFNVRFFDQPIATSDYSLAMFFSALGFLSWLQYAALTTQRTRQAFDTNSKIDLACLTAWRRLVSLVQWLAKERRGSGNDGV